jgi:hypothetical protein
MFRDVLRKLKGVFRLIRLGQEFSQTIQACLPQRTTVGDPTLGHAETFRFDTTGSDPSDFFGAHQATSFQDLQVLHDGGESDVKGLGEPGDRDRAFAQFLNHRAAGGIAEGMKNAVDVDSLGKPALVHHGHPFL